MWVLMVLHEDGVVTRSAMYATSAWDDLQHTLRLMDWLNERTVPINGLRYFLVRHDELPMFEKEPTSA